MEKEHIFEIRFIFCLFKITLEKYLALKYGKDYLEDIPADIRIEEIKQLHKEVAQFIGRKNSFKELEAFTQTCNNCLQELIKEHK